MSKIPTSMLRLGAAALAGLVAAAPGAAAADDWTGPYLGLTLGAKITDARWSTTKVGDPLLLPSVLDSTTPRGFLPDGVRVGGYLGYDWLVASRWVVGVEGDFAWTNAKSAGVGIPGCTILCYAGVPGPGSTSASVRALWDASVRGRAGYLVMPRLLLYGTAGVAFQRIEASATCSNTLDDPVCIVSPPFANKTQTNGTTRMGWTVGVGAEWKIAPQWQVRGEYRYADFGTWRGVFFEGEPAAFPGTDTIRYELHSRTHIATVGLTYKFDWGGLLAIGR